MPKIPDPTAEQLRVLKEIRRLAEHRQAAHDAYIEGILKAAQMGISPAHIKDATGTTDQSVRKLIARHRAMASTHE